MSLIPLLPVIILNKQEVREALGVLFPGTETSGGIKPESFVTKIIFSADSSEPGCETLLRVPGKRAGDDSWSLRVGAEAA